MNQIHKNLQDAQALATQMSNVSRDLARLLNSTAALYLAELQRRDRPHDAGKPTQEAPPVQQNGVDTLLQLLTQALGSLQIPQAPQAKPETRQGAGRNHEMTNENRRQANPAFENEEMVLAMAGIDLGGKPDVQIVNPTDDDFVDGLPLGTARAMAARGMNVVVPIVERPATPGGNNDDTE